MKKILALGFVFLLPLYAQAQAVFTTVSYDGEEFFYLGVKNQDAGKDAATALAVVDSKDLSHELIPLPNAIGTRDVIGVISEGNKIFALTQLTSAEGDNPLLSVYDRSKKTWKNIHSVDCPIFTQVNFKQKELVFHCEQLTKRGKSKVKRKILSLGSERIHRKGAARFPEFLIRYKKMDISLEGVALSWDRLHIKKDAEDQVLHANDLYVVTAAPSAPILSPAPSPVPALSPKN